MHIPRDYKSDTEIRSWISPARNDKVVENFVEIFRSILSSKESFIQFPLFKSNIGIDSPLFPSRNSSAVKHPARMIYRPGVD